MAKKKPETIKRVPKVFKDEAKAEEMEVTKAEAQAVVEELTAKQEAENAKLAAEIEQFKEVDRDRPMFPHVEAGRPIDYTYIPEHVYVDGVQRRLKDPNKAYKWSRYSNMPNGQSKIPINQLRGWKPVTYSPTFDGTGLFQKSTEGWVLNGDTILMEISRDGYRRLQDEIRARYNQTIRAVEEEFHVTGERSGVTTYRDNPKTGRREFN